MWEPMCSVLHFSGFTSSVWIRVCVSKWASLECYIWRKPVWNELSCLSDSGLLLQRFSIWVRCLFPHRGRPLLIEVAHTHIFFSICHSLPALFPPWEQPCLGLFCFYTRVYEYYLFSIKNVFFNNLTVPSTCFPLITPTGSPTLNSCYWLSQEHSFEVPTRSFRNMNCGVKLQFA